MKKRIPYFLYTFLAFFLMSGIAAAQVTVGQIDDFSSGLAGWERGTVVGEELELVADGSGPNGKLVTFNQTQWAGDYAAAGVNQIRMKVTNPGDQTLFLRLALGTGTNANLGSWYASTNAQTVAAGESGYFSFPLQSDDMSLVVGSDDFATVMSGVVTLRILHAELPSAQGDPITATLYLDDIEALGSVGISEFNPESDISIYPSPANDWFAVKGTKPLKSVTVYNMTGSKEMVWVNPAYNTPLAVAELSSGLYIIRINAGNNSRTERLMIR